MDPQPSQPFLVYTSIQWRQSFDHLIALLDGYSDMLLRNLQRFVDIGDNIGAEIIWSSCVTCLAHLSALCELIGRMEPTSNVAMNSLCDSNLEKLGQLTEDLRVEGYTHLDLLLGVRTRTTFRLVSNSNANRKTNALVLMGEIPDRVRIPDQESADGRGPFVAVLEGCGCEGPFEFPREAPGRGASRVIFDA